LGFHRRIDIFRCLACRQGISGLLEAAVRDAMKTRSGVAGENVNVCVEKNDAHVVKALPWSRLLGHMRT
jgi:hypothetical protein